jgi:hypothetical protein
MKNLSAPLLTEKAGANVTVFNLIKIGTAFFYTDCDVSLSYGGNTYAPVPMELPAFRSSDGSVMDSGTIKIGNVDLAMSSLRLNGNLENQLVYVYEAWYDASMALIGVEQLYAGKIDGKPALDELWVTIRTSAHINPWTQRFPRRRITIKDFPNMPRKGAIITWGLNVITIK